MATGYVWLERYGWHDTSRFAGFCPPGPHVQPYEHFESTDSKVRLASMIEVSGLGEHLARLPVGAATEDDIARVHTAEYIRRIQRVSAQSRGGDTGDPGSPFGNGGYDTALLAAGGTMAALGSVLDNVVSNAYALVRPPGHHAEPQQGMGFCVFANVAVAIRWARETHGLGRVAIVDWDVHHGNGTQKIFYDDPVTLTISLHQDNLYPFDSGHLDERGIGDGLGACINIPLPAGSGNGAYLAALRRVVVPALAEFAPEVIVVACGFDAGAYDPLGRMLVTVDGFREMTSVLMEAASTICGGRLVMSHEGGYSAVYVPYCGLGVIETMAGVATGFGDPLAVELNSLPDQRVQPHQELVIQRAADLSALRP